MASSPAFANVPIVGTGLASATADTSFTAPTNQATLTFLPVVGASGAKIEEIIVEATATSVAGLVNVFLHDAATYHYVDTFDVTAITVSTTVRPFRVSRRYENLVIPASTWSLRFTVSIAGLQSIMKVVALGANL